jgi:hypothetical protein
MKVRVTYATELNSVPERVAKIAEESLLPLEEIHDLLSSSLDTLKKDKRSSFYIADVIDRVRKQLTDVDQILSDSHILLKGYNDTITGSLEKPQNIPQPPTPPPNEDFGSDQ